MNRRHEFYNQISVVPHEPGEILRNRLREAEFQLKETEERLRAAKAEAKVALAHANDYLAQFAFGASHDLKEQLRTITTSAELLARNYAARMDPEDARYVTDIINAADRMRVLIQDLVIFSQTQALENLPLQSASLEVVVELVLAGLRGSIQESGAVITYGALPMVMGDVVQLARVFQNLIANAIKYAKPGEPPRIHIWAEESEGPEWVVHVADNGIGFDQKYAEQIFHPFKRLHDRRVPGTGLGLAIARKIIEQHGGKIWVESEPGKGTTFSFALSAASLSAAG